MFNDSLSVRVSDYAAVLDRLKGEYDTVLLLGGSEGATVAEHTALASPAVDAVVAVNGGGRFFWMMSRTASAIVLSHLRSLS